MQQKASESLRSSEHPDSLDMHRNEAYEYTYSSDENLLTALSAAPSPVMHSGKIEVKQVTSVLSSQVNAASHTETEYSYVDDATSGSHPVASKLEACRSLVTESSLAGSLDPLDSKSSILKTSKQLSMSKTTDHNALECPVSIPSDTQPLRAGLSTFEQRSFTLNHTATSPTKHQKLILKSDIGDVAALSLLHPTRKSQGGPSQLSLPLHKSLGDTNQQSQHNQGQPSLVQTLPALRELETKQQEQEMSVPKLIVNHELSTHSVRQSKLILMTAHFGIST